MQWNTSVILYRMKNSWVMLGQVPIMNCRLGRNKGLWAAWWRQQVKHVGFFQMLAGFLLAVKKWEMCVNERARKETDKYNRLLIKSLLIPHFKLNLFINSFKSQLLFLCLRTTFSGDLLITAKKIPTRSEGSSSSSSINPNYQRLIQEWDWKHSIPLSSVGVRIFLLHTVEDSETLEIMSHLSFWALKNLFIYFF